MYDDYDDEDTRRTRRDQQIADLGGGAQVHPGANTGSGPWAPGYDPGPNWNGGEKPSPDALWDMTNNNWSQPTSPRLV